MARPASVPPPIATIAASGAATGTNLIPVPRGRSRRPAASGSGGGPPEGYAESGRVNRNGGGIKIVSRAVQCNG